MSPIWRIATAASSRKAIGSASGLHNPEVLILDEPTAGLDPKQIMETRDLIKSLRGDHTIVLSTHILPEVAQTCDRVVIINKGKVVAVDTPDALTGRLQGVQSLYVQVDAPAVEPVRTALRAANGVTNVTIADQRQTITGFEVECQRDHDIRRDLAKAIVANNWGLLELRPLRMSLEEIFLQLTTSETGHGDASGGTARHDQDANASVETPASV